MVLLEAKTFCLDPVFQVSEGPTIEAMQCFRGSNLISPQLWLPYLGEGIKQPFMLVEALRELERYQLAKFNI